MGIYFSFYLGVCIVGAVLLSKFKGVSLGPTLALSEVRSNFRWATGAGVQVTRVMAGC